MIILNEDICISANQGQKGGGVYVLKPLSTLFQL